MTEPDEVFYERLAGMPFVEAARECSLRREGLALEMAMLLVERKRLGISESEADAIGREMKAIEIQLIRLKGRSAEINKALERLSWKAAVRAVCGEEIVQECLIWMESQRIQA